MKADYRNRLLELADVEHVRSQVVTLRYLSDAERNTGPAVSAVGGGLALLTCPKYGQKLNRVVGLGLRSSCTSEDLNHIESLFRSAETPLSVHFCSLFSPGLEQTLKERGYGPDGSISVYYLDLISDAPTPADDGKIVVTKVLAHHEAKFKTVSLEGFRSGGRPPDLLSKLGSIAVRRNDTTLFLAHVDGELAGSAGLSVLEIDMSHIDPKIPPATRRHKVAQLYIDSTLPQFRGQGVHAALIARRIQMARDMGYELAMLVARSGTASARNARKAGFKFAYEKEILVKEWT